MQNAQLHWKEQLERWLIQVYRKLAIDTLNDAQGPEPLALVGTMPLLPEDHGWLH